MFVTLCQTGAVTDRSLSILLFYYTLINKQPQKETPFNRPTIINMNSLSLSLLIQILTS